jgi:hypothetical protein
MANTEPDKDIVNRPDRVERQPEKTGRRAESTERAEIQQSVENHTEQSKRNLAKPKESNSSGITKFGFNSTESLTGGKPQKAADHFESLGRQDKLEKQTRQHEEFKHKFGDPDKLQGDRPVSGKAAAESPNLQRAVEAAGRVFDSVYKSGSMVVNETGKFLKGMGNGEVEFVKETGDSLGVAKDYYGRAFTGKQNVRADIKEFFAEIRKTLGTASDYYFKQLPEGKANFGRDAGSAAKAAGDHWNSLDTEQKGHFFGKEVVPLAVPGAVGAVAKEAQVANVAAKATEAITTFAGSEKIAELEQKLSVLQGHIQKFGDVMSKPLEPAHATATDSAKLIPFAETVKPDDGLLLKHGDKGLPQGVKPSDKVTVKTSYDLRGYLTHDIDVPKEVFRAAESRGFDQATVQQKMQKIAKSVEDVYLQIGDYDPKIHGSERAYGNRFHELLRQDLQKVNDPLINPEVSFLKGQSESWGKLGTSRIDIGIGEKDKPFASVCLKTLDAVPSAQQERGWVRNLTRLPDGSVPPRLYLKLPKPQK